MNWCRCAFETLQKEDLLLLASDGGLYVDTALRNKIILGLEQEQRIDIWRLAVTLIYRITPKQETGLSLATSWKVFQEWLPNLQAFLECTANPSLSLINERSLMQAPVLVEVIRIHAWFLFEHGRYCDASEILHTAQDLCERLMQILDTSEEYHLSGRTVQLCQASIRDIQGSIAFERNQSVDSLTAKKQALRLKQEANDKQAYIKITESNVALAEILFGDRPKGYQMLKGCVERRLQERNEHKGRWRANIAPVFAARQQSGRSFDEY